VPIPAIAPPPPPPQGGYEPGTLFTDQTATLDDSQGSGVIITFGMADENRVGWRYTDLSGWDSPDAAEGAEAKTGADGMWDTSNFYAGRQVGVEGLIDAPTAAALDEAMARLAQALPLRGRLVTFTVNETTPKQISARRSGRLMMSKLTDVVAQVSIAMLAPDPRKYGVDIQSAAGSLGAPGGGVPLPLALPMSLPSREAGGEFFTVENTGTYETPPLIRIVGPGRNLGIANLTTGQSLRYPFELLSGDELVIDTAAGLAQLNGTAYRSPSAGSEVVARFLLPPGTSHMQFLGSRTDADVTPLLTLTWRPAWM
jgi:hypothetical protein